LSMLVDCPDPDHGVVWVWMVLFLSQF